MSNDIAEAYQNRAWQPALAEAALAIASWRERGATEVALLAYCLEHEKNCRALRR